MQETQDAQKMPEIYPQLLSMNNYQEALAIAKLCFPMAKDQEHVKSTYLRFVNKELINNDAGSRLIVYFLYRNELNSPIGISGIYKEEETDESYWLGWFGVHPDHRKKYYGKAMIDHILKLTKLLGGKALKLYTSDSQNNMPVVEFYKKSGFTFEKKDIYFGEPVIILRKDLLKEDLI